MTPPAAIILDPAHTLPAACRQPEQTWFAIISEHAEAWAGAGAA